MQKGRWKNVEEAAEVMKAYILENLLESYPDSAKDREEAIWADALEKGLLRMPKQANILEDGRRDLRYALQVSSSYSFRCFVCCLRNYVLREVGKGLKLWHLRTLQKFGQEAIADRLGIKVLTMRRPRIRRS